MSRRQLGWGGTWLRSSAGAPGRSGPCRAPETGVPHAQPGETALSHSRSGRLGVARSLLGHVEDFNFILRIISKPLRNF